MTNKSRGLPSERLWQYASTPGRCRTGSSRCLARLILFAILQLLVCPVVAQGSDLDSEEKEGSHQSQSHDSHTDHRHHAGGLIAATWNFDHHHTDFTVGGDYQFRLSPRWAVGGFGEVIFADRAEYLAGVPVYFYATKSFWLRAGPGVEFIQSGEEHHEHSSFVSASEGPTSTKAEFLFRFGFGYNFEVGGLTIAPTLDVDLVRNNRALVWGLAIGKGF